MTPPDAPRPAARWRGRLLDAALVLFVAALGAKAAAGGSRLRDVDLSDESVCVAHALAAPDRGLPAVEFSPLYVLWDAALLRAGVPPADVPFASWAGLAALLPAAVYLLARSAGAGRVAALVAGGVLPATALIDIWPYPMHLAAVVLALGAALAARLRPAPAAAALGLTLLLATYARPEFLYALYLFRPLAAAGGCWLLWRRPAARRAVAGSALGFAAGAAALVGAFGSPQGTGGRSVIALGQHYALNRSLAGEWDGNPGGDWGPGFREDFGEVSTVGGAWRANPDAFLRHVRRNLVRVPKQVRAAADPWVDLQLLHHPHTGARSAPRYAWLGRAVRMAMLAAVVAGLVGAGAGLRRRAGPLAFVALTFGLVAAPAAAACLVVYPRLHYLVPTVAFAAAVAAAGYRYLPGVGRPRGPAATGLTLLAAAAGLAGVVPNRADGWCLQALLGGGENGRTIAAVPAPTRAALETVRGLDLRPPVVFLTHGPAPAVCSGLGAAYVHPAHLAPGEGLAAAVRRLGVGVVILDPHLFAFPQAASHPDLRALSDGRESDLFRLVPVPGHPEIRLAVRRDLLAPTPE